jgi:capsule polysaccharide export protein KpsE/RkpR
VLSGVGNPSAQMVDGGGRNTAVARQADPTPALNGQIRHDETQLNDWVTCVSANTPKGKAEIQSLTARISAARQQIAKVRAESAAAGSSPLLTASEGNPLNVTGAATYENLQSNLGLSRVDLTRPGGLVNTWA